MPNDKQGDYICSNCGREIGEDDDFCPYCGAIFADEVLCDKHPFNEATGVCVVCGVPCCDACGLAMRKPGSEVELFLCNHHSEYEIFEGMVKVLATRDVAEAEIAKARLEEAGLHPALFHLHVIRGKRLVEYEPYGDGQQFNAKELRLMVPCAEVVDAESILGTAAAS